MPMANVQKLFQRIATDTDLRKEFYRASGREGREAILQRENLSFTDAEFDEGIRAMHVKCQSQEAADQLMDFRMWWEQLRNME